MSVGDINVKLGLDTTAFSTALASAKVQALALGGSFDGIGKSLNNLGAGGGALGGMGKALAEIGTASNLATVGLAAIGVAAVAAGAKLASMASEYQSAMAKVAATTGMSNKQLKDMQDLMYQNAATGSRLSMTTQASIAGGLGAAGLIGSTTSAEEQLNLLKLTEKAMVALESPVEDTIDLFSILQTRYGANTTEMSKATSSIAQMADETSATNPEIIQATLTMGRLASTVHMSVPEMVALAAATKSSGIQAAEVGTQWSSLTRNLSSKTEGAAAAFEALGMSQDEWFQALQDSKNTGSNAPVLKFLGKLDAALKKSDKSAEQSMQLFGSYGALLGGSISQVIAKNETLIVSSQKAYDENVRIEQEYKRMTDTMGSMIDAIGAKFNAIGVRMGTVLLKPIQDATYQFDQFLGKVMQGDFAGAWKGMYDAVLDYDWMGAGMSIASMIASGLGNLASFAAQALVQLANSILTHDWIASGRSIADKIVSGLSSIGPSAKGAIGDVSDWVDSGGAKSAGEGLANWVIQGAQSVFSAGVDLLGWIRTNFTLEKISGIVRSAFNMGSEIITLGIRIGTDFVSGISKAITDSGGSYFSGIATAAAKVIADMKTLGVDIARAGVSYLNDAANGVLSALSGKIQPLLDTVNSVLGTSYKAPTSTGYNDTYVKGTVTKDLNQTAEDMRSLWNAAVHPGQNGGSNWISDPSLAKLQGDPDAVMEMMAQSGIPFDEAFQKATQVVNGGSGNYSKEWARKVYDQAAYMSTPGGMSGLSGMQGLTNISGAYKGGTTAGKAGTTGATTLANQWTAGVVPVEVTNWPAGGIGGGVTAGGTQIAGVNSYGQTVDANGLPVGKFDASKINTSGPGIGMVKTDGGNTNASYADRLNIDTCEIDSFGMTPGLGAELAASGAWRPNAGAASQKLAAEINYQGDYAEPSQYGSILGGLNSAIKTSNTTQITTANKTAGITVGAATKATGITIGGTTQAAYSFQSGAGVAAKTMEASALNAKIIAEDGAYSCFNIWGEGSQRVKEDWESCGEIINQAGASASSSISASGTHVSDSTVKMSDSLKYGADEIKAAGTSIKDGVSSAMAGLTAQGSAFLATTFGGLFTGIGMGGGSTNTGGISYTGAGSWGGTSISGGGGWVGTLATGGTTGPGQTTWGGTAASQAASAGGSGSWGSVKWFADGGIITKPSIVGVGEAGTEAIVPIGKLPDIMAQAMGGAGGAQMVHTVINVDGRKLADVTGPAIIKRVQQAAGLKVR